jgi:uridine kinase
MTTTIGRTKISQTSVNKAAHNNPQAFMHDCDQRYEKHIGEIVRQIAEDTDKSKIILLSGPSASGKTTTSFKIEQGLERLGINAVTISMDDFFMPRELTPMLPDGSRDYESLEALNLPLLKSLLSQLITEGRAELPSFNFKLGRCIDKTTTVELRDGSVAVMEGLHALDTAVTGGLPDGHMLKLYVSVSSDFESDSGETVLTAREARLIRRMIRDYHFRGSSPENTLDMWNAVCHGEDKYIRPFKIYADKTVNSVFKCEPCLLAESAIKLFGTIGMGSRHFETARHMISALGGFEQMPLEIIPGSCMLREFIGGSDYYNKSSIHRTV